MVALCIDICLVRIRNHGILWIGKYQTNLRMDNSTYSTLTLYKNSLVFLCLMSLSCITYIVYNNTNYLVFPWIVVDVQNIQSETESTLISNILIEMKAPTVFRLNENETFSNILGGASPQRFSDTRKFQPKLQIIKNLTEYCTFVPSLEVEIVYNNKYWQVSRFGMEAEELQIFGYGAYYDNRYRTQNLSTIDTDYIRIIANSEVVVGNQQFWCHLWYSDSSSSGSGKEKVITVKASYPLMMWFSPIHDGLPIPYMFSCPIPKIPNVIPDYISLVRNVCSKYPITNKLKVQYLKPEKGQKKSKVAVCLKPTNFMDPTKDFSLRLIEWIELNRIFGSTKIYMYTFSALPNTQKVMKYYENDGIVELIPSSLPGSLPNEPQERTKWIKNHHWRHNMLEFVFFNDCFYRYMNMYEYILPMDVDEIIVPTGLSSWIEVLDKISTFTNGINYGSLSAIHDGCYFEGVERPYLDEVPKYLYMLQHIYKVDLPQVYRRNDISTAKSFHNTNETAVAFTHYSSHCLHGPCKEYPIPVEWAHLQHYKDHRRACGTVRKGSAQYDCTKLECKEYYVDKSMWKYKDELVKRVNQTVLELGLNFTDALL